MSKNNFEFTVESWTVVEENKEYSTPIYNLLKQRCRLPSEDHEGTFYILDAPTWINVIPLTEKREVILVEQYRYGTKEPTLEIPGGMVDEGETPEEAALRELLEETGYRAGSLQSLGKVSANPAIMSNYAHCYLARDCLFEGAENPDTHERIQVHRVSKKRFLELIREGSIHHSVVVAAAAKWLLLDG
ncbi:MAG: NUDIX hydrolase [Balneolaceae bacterium]|nr:NUDIX hydrolase [Balneolaceae bacterium]